MARFPTVRSPNEHEIFTLAHHFGLSLTDSDVQAFRGLMARTADSYARLDELPEQSLRSSYPRTPGYRPPTEENRYNAWYWKNDIRGRPNGPLTGKRVVIKDNICVAGVPMMNGATILEGYVPDIDATVVTRALDAGGTITGKAACTYLCYDGGSHTAATGMIENPRKAGHSSGGSSAGCAVLIAAGEADLALGTDQGGSIRIPSSWTGICGLKPTHGLVPYTGLCQTEQTLDHCGPMASSVHDVALLLQAIAGPDGLDPRQGEQPPQDYLGGLDDGVAHLRIGVLKEGFGLEESEPIVDQKVRRAARVFSRLGALVREISVPMHAHGLDIWTPIAIEGSAVQIFESNGMGWNWRGFYHTSLITAFAQAWRSRPNDLSDTVKLVLLLGAHFRRAYHGRYHAKAQNLSRLLRAAYDSALETVDVLVMPTIPMRATLLPEPDCSREDKVMLALEMIRNVAPFDSTSHPAMTIPCGTADDLPIGLMIVGRRHDDATVLRVAQAFEQATDWRAI
jgi:amidase